MLPPMLRLLARVFLLSALTPFTTAQRSLAEVQQQFIAESRQLGPEPTRAQRDELLGRQVGQLRTYVESEAKGDDRWNGRLMLADLLLARGDRAAAGAALQSIDAEAAPAMVLITAAAMAQHLNLQPQREAWIRAALGKQPPLSDRLAMARMLVTVLREVGRGENLFATALAGATDDEERALVRWHRADAMRDREELPENAAFEELEKLAADLPKTYWGDVAKDRLRATQLKPGDAAIAFQAKSRTGEELSSRQLAGKAIVLVFWSSSDMDTPKLVETVKELRKRCGEKLAVVGICLDRDPATIAAAVQQLGIDFPVVGDGKGVEADIPLRWFVEGPVVHVIDAAGKIAGLGLHAGTADGRAELTEIVERASGT